MEMIVVAIYDVAAAVYSRPVFCASKGLAVRSFQDECRSAESPMSKHPDDYSLFLLGTFDDVFGKFGSVDSGQPILLFKGSDCK